MSTSLSRTLPPLVLLALVALSGCGIRRGDVSGKVTFKGQPLPAGRITFVCEAGDKPSLQADIKDGTYSIANAPAGPAKVAVATYQTKFVKVPGMPANVAPPESSAPYVAIPVRYHDPEKSGLTYEIKAGKQTHDLDLTP